MSYIHRIHQEGEEIYIQEFRGEDIDFEWHIDKLKNDATTTKGKWNESFMRTKKWLQENHPELLL